MSQFAMVEELAFLIKDNLPCKHLVLSMEEAFVNFLQENASPDGVMELEPMNPYNRLLLHRLADIFGFAHESVGEEDERHLILERCPETSIPSILVSDILWQFDESESGMTSHQLLRRMDTSPVLRLARTPQQYSLEEREAAYLAARERIFAVEESKTTEYVKQKPRSVPVVARRMIAHALGQKTISHNQEVSPGDDKCNEEQTMKSNFQNDYIMSNLKAEAYRETDLSSSENVNLLGKIKDSTSIISASSRSEKLPPKPVDNKFGNGGVSQNGRNGSMCNDKFKEQHLGAAKRMFAHALGRQSTKEGISKFNDAKLMNRE